MNDNATPNTLFRVFPATQDDGPLELEGTNFNSQEDLTRAFEESGQGEHILSRTQLEAIQSNLQGDFPADTVFGLDVDSDMAVVNLGQFPDQAADEVWKDEKHQCQYTFGVEEAKQIFGVV